MSEPRARLPLEARATQAADEALSARYPDLNGRALTLSSSDEKYRTFWMKSYAGAGGALEAERPDPPSSPVQSCPRCKDGCGQSAGVYQLLAEVKIPPTEIPPT